MKNKINKSKKALSEIISYVLLIMIAMAIAAAVFAWIKYYVPSENERASCPDSVSLYLEKYSCDINNKLVNLTIQNKGLFNIDGFYIRGSNSTTKKPIVPLLSKYPDMVSKFGEGIYVFAKTGIVFSPNEKVLTEFSYTNLTNLATIQIQPYIYSSTIKKTMVLCPNIVQINLENC